MIKNKKIIYLGAYKAEHKNYNITYQDINGSCTDLSNNRQGNKNVHIVVESFLKAAINIDKPRIIL